MKSRIAILPGDGIGPEVMNEALKVLDVISQKSGIKFDFNKGLVGASAIDEYGDPFPDQTKVYVMNLTLYFLVQLVIQSMTMILKQK